MAQIILKAQVINFGALHMQFPRPLPPRRKLVFHCELRSLDGGYATFGLIAYPAWRRGLAIPWTIGDKVDATDSGAGDMTFPLTPLVAFSNNEIRLAPRVASTFKDKDHALKALDESMKKMQQLLKNPSNNLKEIGNLAKEIDQASIYMQGSETPGFSELLKKIDEELDEGLLKKSYLKFKPGLSKNVHPEYTVTLDYGGTTSDAEAKPRPPYPPEE